MRYLKYFIMNFRIARQRGKSFKEAWSTAAYFANIMRKTIKNQNPYTHIGSIGLSPDYLKMYEDSMKKISEFERK